MREELAGHRTATSSATRTKHLALVERAAPGDSVLVVGRAREGAPAELRATGPESLALVAVPAGIDPRAWLRTHVVAHAVVVIVLLGLSAVGLAVQATSMFP